MQFPFVPLAPLAPLAASAFLALALMAPAAQAEQRVFILANYADGYGIDRCLATGADCGSAAATAYCRSHAFTRAVSYRKLDKSQMTGTAAARSEACQGEGCGQFVAIMCAR